MDYFDVLKKAWRITWRYKILWVLGLFAGASSSGSSSSNWRSSSDDFSSGGQQAQQWFADNLAVVIIIVGVLFLVALLFWVLSVAAQGGLVYGANEAAEERTPSLRTAWGVGFSKWGRTFMINLVLGLPVFLIAMVAAGIAIAAGLGGAAIGDRAGGLAALGGLCFVLPLFVVLIIAVAVVIGIIYPLALRYGVLQNITFGQAIKRGWYDLRAKRGAFVFWLVMLLPGFAMGVLTLLIMAPFFVPAILLFIGEQYAIGVALLVVGGLVLLLPMAIYGTFVSSAWTVFFRKMTGMEAASISAYPAPGAYAPVPPAGYAPPAPPAYESPVPSASEPDEAPIVEVPAETSIADVDAAAPPVVPVESEEAPPADE